ncbi:hypothetical protein GCM10009117_25850 [Gangjinia marincola]|uniref:Peptidase n=1 Tax=Gangjinia marincola TaxID=578463 RepID=A0ABP3XYF7_9FLAO
MKMINVKAVLSCLALSAIVMSCSKDEVNENQDEINALEKEVSQDIKTMIDDIGLNQDFVKYDTFYYPDGSSEERLMVEEDVFMTETELQAFHKEHGVQEGGRQYSTTPLVSQGRNISIIGFTGGGGQGLSSKERTALQWAVNNYNRLSGVSISFTLTFGTDWQSKDMVVYRNPNQSGSGGSAGFPSNGNPFKFVQIYGLGNLDTNVIEHVITHEVGHSVGFRHTDWFSRQSCGQNVNEGGDVNYIPGTPNGFDPTSVMLACFSNNEDGEFNNNDIIALQFLY